MSQRRVLTAALAGLAACLAAGAARPAAAGSLTLCNEGSETIRYAVVWESSLLPPATESWDASGWHDVASGCTEVLNRGTRLQAFLSVLRVSKQGKERIAHYAFDSDEAYNTLTTGSVTAERFFCVSDTGFNRSLPTLPDHESCPEGYYHQLFNLYVGAEIDAAYTLRLK